MMNVRLWRAALGGALAALVVATPAGAGLDPETRFAAARPNQDGVRQVAQLRSEQRFEDAELVRALLDQPTAVWLTDGTPAEVERQARQAVRVAAAKQTVPVLVAYNLPFRDCAQYSAGGAVDTAAYLAWIDGLARGLGEERAVLVLEPDGLGIIPYNTDLNGAAEWCRPDLTGTGLTPATANSERYAQLSAAVDRLAAQPGALVYLDATHPAWLGVGDVADRLARAGVARARGFFLNASNYQYTANAVRYGTWISRCLETGAFAACPNQYWNGGPDGTVIAALLGPWTGVALSPYGIWSDSSPAPELNTSGIEARLPGPGRTPFVVDTSRNGLGPWRPSVAYPDPQDWCNPPGRGVGPRPTADTGDPLVDALLWIKVPGESDGQCSRGLGPTGTVDPEWGVVDPAAGRWFPDQALELARLASPPLAP